MTESVGLTSDVRGLLANVKFANDIFLAIRKNTSEGLGSVLSHLRNNAGIMKQMSQSLASMAQTQSALLEELREIKKISTRSQDRLWRVADEVAAQGDLQDHHNSITTRLLYDLFWFEANTMEETEQEEWGTSFPDEVEREVDAVFTAFTGRERELRELIERMRGQHDRRWLRKHGVRLAGRIADKT